MIKTNVLQLNWSIALVRIRKFIFFIIIFHLNALVLCNFYFLKSIESLDPKFSMHLISLFLTRNKSSKIKIERNDSDLFKSVEEIIDVSLELVLQVNPFIKYWLEVEGSICIRKVADFFESHSQRLNEIDLGLNHFETELLGKKDQLVFIVSWLLGARIILSRLHWESRLGFHF